MYIKENERTVMHTHTRARTHAPFFCVLRHVSAQQSARLIWPPSSVKQGTHLLSSPSLFSEYLWAFPQEIPAN